MSTEELLEHFGYERECESPLEIRNAEEEAFATNNAARYVINALQEEYAAEQGVLVQHSRWIINHDDIHDHQRYVVMAIGITVDGQESYLYDPKSMLGWQYKRLRKNCYAALALPLWPGLPEEWVDE